MHEKVRNISDSNNEDVVRKYGIPEIDEEQRKRGRKILEDIESVTIMEKNICRKESTSNYEKINNEQKSFCDNALEIMLGDTDEKFLVSLDAVTGTGKTFTLNVIIAKLLKVGKSVIAAAFAGIAGTLVIGGSTFHSQTNAPLNPCK